MRQALQDLAQEGIIGDSVLEGGGYSTTHGQEARRQGAGCLRHTRQDDLFLASAAAGEYVGDELLVQVIGAHLGWAVDAELVCGVLQLLLMLSRPNFQAYVCVYLFTLKQILTCSR